MALKEEQVIVEEFISSRESGRKHYRGGTVTVVTIANLGDTRYQDTDTTNSLEHKLGGLTPVSPGSRAKATKTQAQNKHGNIRHRFLQDAFCFPDIFPGRSGAAGALTCDSRESDLEIFLPRKHSFGRKTNTLAFS
ncbi:hypothetical protein CEXT_472841 [Caerostris extrusa]|uniref:Uncharacterized protein n=1 Tax=Caerostris extrusa TaxID=172846 RepID=A0AAV4X7D7_CAEEX|nr:hypothetical protein CEXT_472841 [Caerostris extrusa]